jgi:hypothetical protein
MHYPALTMAVRRFAFAKRLETDASLERDQMPRSDVAC